MTYRLFLLIVAPIGQRSRAPWPGTLNPCLLNAFKPIGIRGTISGVYVGFGRQMILARSIQ